MLGMTIAERYRIEAEIGAGSMGTVYRAQDTHTSETVALKVLRADAVAADEQSLRRFIREGEALRRLNHPNIVKMLDFFEEEGQHYLVMEYIDGGNLDERLQAATLSIERVLRIALDLADALTRAHKLEIVHRDLKPANVLIGDGGEVYLTDFGVAQIEDPALGKATREMVAVGTLDYMSPEALNGQGVDTRADIWSFGVVLYELLTRRRPFSGDTVMHTMNNIMSAPPADIAQLRPDAPIELVDLIYRMLNKDPYARITTVRRVGLEIEELLGTKSPVARADSDGTAVQVSRFGSASTNRIIFTRHNLPAETMPFVGRVGELEQLRQLFDLPKTRLITLMGAGGIGKTSLALEYARRVLSRYEDGVYFIELAPLDDPAAIVPTIASEIGYPFQADDRSQKQQLLDYLRAKEMLLVLDNYEHLMAGRGLVGEILKACPTINIIATSREKLNQAGENVLILTSMDFPDWETPADALKYSAVKLFVQSARRSYPAYQLDDDDLVHVARICRMVQGLPLGIVLAAAWTAMLSADEIADEIARNADFLEGETDGLPDRHRSVRAVFDYSWQLLTETEREIFAQLSVFRGSFTRQAAQGITKAGLRTLMSLVNKSLITRSPDTGRYHMHVMLQQYAFEHLQSQPQSDRLRRDHCQYYLDAVHAQERGLKNYQQLDAITDIEYDLLNLRSAWDYALQMGLYDYLRRSAEAIALFMMHSNRDREGGEWFKATIDHLTATDAETQMTRARLVPRWIFMRWNSSRKFDDLDALLGLADEVLKIAKAQLTAHDIAYNTVILGFLSTMAHNFEVSDTLYDEAYDRFRKLDDTYYMAFVLYRMGFIEAMKGRLDRLTEKTRRSLALRRKIGDVIGEGASLNHLGVSLLFLGDFDSADEYLSDAVKILEPTGNLFNLAHTLANLGLLRFMAGDFERAYPLAQRANQHGRDLQQAIGQALGLSIMSAIDCLEGRADEALTRAQTGQQYVENASIAYTSDLALAIVYASRNARQHAHPHIVNALTFALQAGFPSMMAAALPVAAVWLDDPVLLAQVSAIDAPAMRWAQGWSPYQTAVQTVDAPLPLSTDLHTFSQTVLDKLQQVTPV